jgi:hypothetical protein
VSFRWMQKVIKDVTPAEAGVQVRKFWIPVFTGMTPKVEAEEK